MKTEYKNIEQSSIINRVKHSGETYFFSSKQVVTPIVQYGCSSREKEKKLQRKETDSKRTTTNSSLENYVGNLNGSGQTLPDEVRNFYEPRFGYDFRNVKVHTDTVAAKSAQSINALAYTSGNNIVFNNGQYSPDTDSGKRLLGHELTHVVQQSYSIQTKKIQRTTGDGHDLTAGRFAGDLELEAVYDGELIYRHGANGAGVQKLQQALLDLGYQLPQFGADGSYGNETESAVRDFQRNSGLDFMEIDGRVGPQTMTLLNDQFSGEVPPPPGTLPVCPLPTDSFLIKASFAGGALIPGVTCQLVPPQPKPAANNPVCTKICGAGSLSLPEKLTIGKNIFTLCACAAKQVHFNTGPGHVNFVTKVADGLLTIDSDHLIFTTGFQGQNIANTTPAWEYTAGVGFDQFIPAGGSSREKDVDTGFIQTIESLKWSAKYGNSWERNLTESNAHDEQKKAVAPWYGIAGGHDEPKEVSNQVNITDEPQVVLSVVHPDPAAKCAKLQEVVTEGIFHLWLIAAEKSNPTTNLIFLFHASVIFNRTFALNSPGNDPSNILSWKAGGTQSESNAGFGKGAKTPILITPLPALTFNTKTGTPCLLNKKTVLPDLEK